MLRPHLRHVRRRWMGRRLAARFSGMQGTEPFVSFRCNICGQESQAPRSWAADREKPSCTGCGSNLRYRTLVHALSLGLFGDSFALPDFPETDARGIGMSDSDVYADPLAKRLNYTNTYYDRPPRLDILRPVAAALGTLDFVICSEVFEHVPPPVDRAFENLRALIRPGGFCVFSVPAKPDGDTVEHFPDLFEYRLERQGADWALVNRTHDGREQRFTDLRFHHGPGSTLEMRLFSVPSLLAELEIAGFTDIKSQTHSVPEFGIIWDQPDSFIVTLRNPARAT